MLWFCWICAESCVRRMARRKMRVDMRAGTYQHVCVFTFVVVGRASTRKQWSATQWPWRSTQVQRPCMPTAPLHTSSSRCGQKLRWTAMKRSSENLKYYVLILAGLRTAGQCNLCSNACRYRTFACGATEGAKLGHMYESWALGDACWGSPSCDAFACVRARVFIERSRAPRVHMLACLT